MALAASVSLGKFFARNGPLQTAHSGYEYRPGQIEMATAVAEALEERRHLFIEAGTGTGKTLAYLLPVLQSGRRVLLSTGTRNLQEQLVTKDVPLLANALGHELTVICMKGRQNYACKQKIADFHSQPGLLERDEYDMLTRIRAWAAETETGDQAELDFLPENHPLWQRLNARRETCTGQKCPQYDSCFLTSLHQRAAAADMVVVNHHLFFADLRLKGQDLAGVLPPYEAVVFDEAHELEAIAGQYFGIGVSSHQIEDLARDASAHLKMLDLASPDMDARIEYVRLAAQKFFMCFGAREGRTVFEERPRFVQDHAEIYDQYMGSLAYLQSGLDAIHDKPEEVHNLMRRAGDLRQQTAYIVESEDEGVVYWVERRGRGVHLQASPIEVAALLRDQLFDKTDTVIMTSATLAVSGGFEYVRGRLGVE
ncbi:MAG TPA: ATP-dependent DNA helicase, partial [Terriglobales bacterium]|nr:ATP-dependent DNA helicase [Terriglobales bacterium]